MVFYKLYVLWDETHFVVYLDFWLSKTEGNQDQKIIYCSVLLQKQRIFQCRIKVVFTWLNQNLILYNTQISMKQIITEKKYVLAIEQCPVQYD